MGVPVVVSQIQSLMNAHSDRFSDSDKFILENIKNSATSMQSKPEEQQLLIFRELSSIAARVKQILADTADAEKATSLNTEVRTLQDQVRDDPSLKGSNENEQTKPNENEERKPEEMPQTNPEEPPQTNPEEPPKTDPLPTPNQSSSQDHKKKSKTWKVVKRALSGSLLAGGLLAEYLALKEQGENRKKELKDYEDLYNKAKASGNATETQKAHEQLQDKIRTHIMQDAEKVYNKRQKEIEAERHNIGANIGNLSSLLSGRSARKGARKEDHALALLGLSGRQFHNF
jgi:microcompartment protein CcmK/EutM